MALFVLGVATTAPAGAQESVWEAMARANPEVSPERLAEVARQVLATLPEDQVRSFLAGRDPASILLADGQSLVDYLAQSLGVRFHGDPFESQINIDESANARYSAQTFSTESFRFAGFLSRSPGGNVYQGLCRSCSGTSGLADQWVLFDNIVATSRVILDPAGRVGIGVQPLATLDVMGPSDASDQRPLFSVGATDATHAINAGPQIVWVRRFNGAYNLELFEGDAYKPGGGSWAVVSDERLKKNVSSLDGALERLLRLRPVRFEYRDPGHGFQVAGQQIGLIAQEVEEVFPEWITRTAEGYKGVAFKGFEALAVQGLRELREETSARLAQKDRRIAELEARLARLEALMVE